MKKRYKILLFLFIITTIWTIYANRQEYQYPEHDELQKKLNYLSEIIQAAPEQDYELQRLESENPEWMLFTLSFSSYALTNICRMDSSFREHAAEIMDAAIQKAMRKELYHAYFGENDPFYPQIDSSGSVLYFGHLNLMLVCYRLCSKDMKYNALNDRLSASLYQRFLHAPTKCLNSYPNLIWIPDNTVALASLALHSGITGSPYKQVATDWIQYARTHFSDPASGLLCSTLNAETGKPLEEARGSMIGWSIFFVNHIDKAYASALYQNYRNKFSHSFLAFRLFRERMSNWETSPGDIDSGPLLLGYGIPANAFAFGDAVAMKDLRSARSIQRLIKLGAKRIEENNKIKYETRFIDLPVSPLAEALMLYCETMQDWP